MQKSIAHVLLQEGMHHMVQIQSKPDLRMDIVKEKIHHLDPADLWGETLPARAHPSPLSFQTPPVPRHLIQPDILHSIKLSQKFHILASSLVVGTWNYLSAKCLTETHDWSMLLSLSLTYVAASLTVITPEERTLFVDGFEPEPQHSS